MRAAHTRDMPQYKQTLRGDSDKKSTGFVTRTFGNTQNDFHRNTVRYKPDGMDTGTLDTLLPAWRPILGTLELDLGVD